MPATILVVEDDFLIRLTLSEALQDAGYQVVEASTGPEALKAIERSPEVALMITDINLRGRMDGHALAQTIQQSHPGLSVLFTSGYSSGAFALGANALFLAKPYVITQILDRVSRLLRTQEWSGREDSNLRP